MPTPVSIAQWESWRADDYFREYYSEGVPPDELAAIQFQVSFLRRAGREFPRAVEYGCGPTLQRAIAAAPYVASLDMADRLDGNLEQVRRWAAGDPRADDWSRFTEYVLRCEGEVEPSREAVLAREARTCQVLSEFLPTDAQNRQPLGAERLAYYDLLITGFCLDCFTQSKTVWQQCMSNVFGLLKPGGAFVVLALRSCEWYRVGERRFPGANITRVDLESALVACGADPARMEIVDRDLPSHADQGYQGVLLTCGWIAAKPGA